MKIRKRRHPSGNVSWQLDVGIIDGKRVQLSFKTQAEAVKGLEIWDKKQAQDGCVAASMMEARKQIAALREMNAQLLMEASQVDGLRAEIERLKTRVEVLEAQACDGVIPEALKDLAEVAVSHAVPRSPGVYFLISAGKVVYVGQGLSIFRRIHDHASQPYIQFDSVCWITVSPARLNYVERFWIKRLRPEENRRFLPLPPEQV